MTYYRQWWYCITFISGIVNYTVHVAGPSDQAQVTVDVLDATGTVVERSFDLQGAVTLQNVNAWWPYTMNASAPGYLYTLEVSLLFLHVILFLITYST